MNSSVIKKKKARKKNLKGIGRNSTNLLMFLTVKNFQLSKVSLYSVFWLGLLFQQNVLAWTAVWSYVVMTHVHLILPKLTKIQKYTLNWSKCLNLEGHGGVSQVL